jgi:hypothetical protein
VNDVEVGVALHGPSVMPGGGAQSLSPALLPAKKEKGSPGSGHGPRRSRRSCTSCPPPGSR